MHNQRKAKPMKRHLLAALALTSAFSLQPSTLLTASPLGTAFTYQGQLSDGGQPAQGTYDLQFAIYDAADGGTPIGGALTTAATSVSNGLFTVLLDFGNVFHGSARWLEIGVRATGSMSDFTLLAPRQPLTPAPYALYTPSAGAAGSAAAVSGPVAASQLTGTISPANIGAGTVTTAMLAAGSVGASQLASGAVTTSALADGAVTATKMATVTADSWFLAGIFTNPTPATGDNFGYCMAVVGTDGVLIGAVYDDTGATDAGAAYLLNVHGTWLATFTNPTPAAGDIFGSSVAAVGTDGVLIGACRDDTGATDAGAAYLFAVNGTLLATFTNPTPATADNFGRSVAAVGTDRVLIGADRDDRGATDAGVAYLFSTNGALLTTFTNPTPAIYDYFGYPVAAVGSDRVLIVALYDDTGAANAGAAYLFSTNGTLLTTFTNPALATPDYFGCSVVALGSDRVLIGAHNNDTGAPDAGIAYLFSANGTLLTTFTNPTPSAEDQFGRLVAVLGNDRVLIGAPGDDTGAEGAGIVYLFSTNGTLLTTLTNPILAGSQGFGSSVAALGAGRLLIGAENDDTGAPDAGAAYLFTPDSYTPGLVADGVRAGSVTTLSLAPGAVGSAQLADGAVTPIKMATPTALLLNTFTNPTPASYDDFGRSLAALGDDRVVIGACHDDTGATDAGIAYIFSTNGTLLTTFTNPTPPTAYDVFAYSVAALGRDRVLIGAPYDQRGGEDGGVAYLFRADGTLLTTFTNPTPSGVDEFGFALAAVGSDHVLIGNYMESFGSTYYAGAAYLFSTNGALVTTFTNPAPASYEDFGCSLAAVGNDRVLIGAYGDDTGGGSGGAAYLFSTNGTLLATLTNPTPGEYDRFGYAVAGVANDAVLVSAYWDNSGANQAGAAYLFSTNGTLLTTFTNPTPEAFDHFGYSLAAVGSDRVLIGAPGDDSGTPSAGAVYLFSTNGTLLTTFQVLTAAFGDFGSSVAAVGRAQVLIGAPYDRANAGAAYLLDFDDYHLPGWVADHVLPGAITSEQIAAGAVQAAHIAAGAVDSTRLAAGAVGASQLATNAVTSASIANGSVALEDLNSTVLSDTFWRQNGNAGTTPGTYFLGTTDNQPLELKVNGQRGFRLEPNDTQAPNVVGGAAVNFVSPGVVGATIGGGGVVLDRSGPFSNSVGGAYGTVSGGVNNHIDIGADRSAIGGGSDNTISSFVSAIAGGQRNTIQTDAASATIGGGSDNTIQTNAAGATISGGVNNKIHTEASDSVIAGGSGNNIQSSHGSIGGGDGNAVQTNASYATVAGGRLNSVYPDAVHASIGGGWANYISASNATIAGGVNNRVYPDSPYGAIGGGSNNYVLGSYGMVPGGRQNSAFGTYSFAAGNRAKANHAGSFVWGDSTDADVASSKNDEFVVRAIGGLRFVTAGAGATLDGGLILSGMNSVSSVNIQDGTITDADISTNGISGSKIVGGDLQASRLKVGLYPLLSGAWSTIAGGCSNSATSMFSAVGGGLTNTASGNFSVVAGGANNLARYDGAVVPGGLANTASGWCSFAAGNNAKALHDGCFVWADGTGDGCESTDINQFLIRATNGVGINMSPAGYGHSLVVGGSVLIRSNLIAHTVIITSDREAKQDFSPVDTREILDRLADVPIQTWSFKNEAGTRHVGPMAQDFHAAFGVGADDKHIATVDGDGVALAAIQGLYRIVKDKDAEIDELRCRLAALESAISLKANRLGPALPTAACTTPQHRGTLNQGDL